MKVTNRRDSSQRQSPDLSQFYKSVPVGLCCLDLDLRYVHINEWLAAINGISVQEHLGRTIGEVLPDVAAGVESLLRQVIETGEPILDGTVESQTQAQPEIKRIFQHSYLPVKSDDDTIIGVTCAVQDITERKHAEAALKSSEQQLRLITDNLPALIAYVDSEQHYRFANPAYAQWFGRSVQEVVGMPIRTVVGEAAYRLIVERIDVVLSGQQVDFEVWLPLPDRAEACARVRYLPHFTKDEQVQGFFVLVTDITDIKLANDQLRSSERRFRSVVESANDAIILADGLAQIVSWNQAAQTIFGYSDEEVLGKPLMTLMPERYREPHTKGLERFAQTGEARAIGQTVELEGLRKDGSEFPLELSLSSWKTVEGRFYCGTIRDFTERKRVEKELDSLRAQLAHVNRLSSMSEMAINLAHEISQPLSAIANDAGTCVELSRQDRLDARDLQQVLRAINEQALRAGEIVARLKRFTMRSVPNRSTLDINEVVREVERFVRHDALIHQSQLCCELDKQLPTVQADAVQLQQVLVNLLLNAFEAMEETEAHPHEVIIRTSAEADKIRVSVCDQGTGLTPDQLECVFEPYFTTKADGLGLGLSISQTIIEAHAGRLWAVPNDDRGMTFYFTLPTASATVEA